VPRLNGLPLVPSKYVEGAGGTGISSGQIFLQSQPSTKSSATDVMASWESTCLNGEASIVTVRLHPIIDDDARHGLSGFTTSFKQKGHPTVLHHKDRPISQLTEDIWKEWLVPDHDRLSAAPALSDPQVSVDVLLQVEYAKLAKLQEDTAILHERIHATLKVIMGLLKQKFTACSSVRCLWDTAVSEASPIANLIASHFQQQKKLLSGCKQGDVQSPCSAKTEAEMTLDALEVSHDELDDFLAAPASSSAPSLSHLKSTATLYDPSQPTTRAVAASSPTSYAQAAPTSSAAHSASPSPTMRASIVRPHANEDQFALQRKLGIAIIVLVLLVIISGLVIRAVIRFRDPRRRAERAARWEERRTKRLYRKAACKHQWRTFWKNIWTRKQRPEDYEEKRCTILAEEALLAEDGSGLSKEIRTMQNTSDLVRDLMQAEEGRARGVRCGQAYPDGFEPAALRGPAGSSASSDIAPSYKSDMTPPPRYAQELDGEMVIVSGFGYYYTPSNTDETPESSIVDCSPRLSLDTGRSTVMTKDTQD
jgi:hypothetical protein